ncbi:MAG: hypothetical protein QME35_02575 [Thermoanaerobacteraceae bacterium]|nr:hypothetical protein [Thermoanaerobacteraceae bacterium]
MKKSKMLIAIGLFENAVILLLNHFINLPDFVVGLGYGIGTGLELVGLYFIKHNNPVMPNWKRKLYKKFTRLSNE